MKSYVKFVAAAVLLTMFGLQTGCDQNESGTDSDSPPADAVGKGSASEGLGRQLAADRDFQLLRKLVIDADRRARLKYFAGANLKVDQAFARAAEKQKELSAADQSRLSEIRGLSADEFQQLLDLRNAVVERFPEIATLTEEELQEALVGAGVGKNNAVGKTLDRCSDCYYAYNSCISTAEFRHAVETMSCVFLVESLFGGTACYLASLTKYFWAVTTCNQTKQYCLSGNGCLTKALNDTA